MSKKNPRPQSLARELIEALADVLADRVVERLAESQKRAPMPEKVPMWLMGPKQPRGKRRRLKGGESIDDTLRNAGMVKHGDPGYAALLAEFLEHKQSKERARAARVHLKKAERLLEKALAGSAASGGKVKRKTASPRDS